MFGSGSGLPAGTAIKVTPDQQKEQKCNGRIIIGVWCALDGLCQAHAQGKDHAETDWHIHIDPTMAEGTQGRPIKRHPGIDRSRHGNQGGNPMKQITGCPAHALKISRPDRHRQQHDVAGGKTGDSQTTQQFLVARLGGLFKGGRVKWNNPVAHLKNRTQQAIDIFNLARPRQAQPACGHIDPCRHDGSISLQKGFNQPDAGGTMNAIHHQMQVMRAVGIRAGKVGEIEMAEILFIRAKGPDFGINRAAFVIGRQAQLTQKRVGTFTARAAKIWCGRGHGCDAFAAMATGGRLVHGCTTTYSTVW